jgi:hypothetical protein
MPSRFDIAMLHKRGVDVIEGVPPAIGTSLTTIEIGYVGQNMTQILKR